MFEPKYAIMYLENTEISQMLFFWLVDKGYKVITVSMSVYTSDFLERYSKHTEHNILLNLSVYPNKQQVSSLLQAHALKFQRLKPTIAFDMRGQEDLVFLGQWEDEEIDYVYPFLGMSTTYYEYLKEFLFEEFKFL